MICDDNKDISCNSNENSDDDSYELNKEECFICSKFMNIKLRLPINCDFCDYIACTECIKRYLKEIKIDPHCMNCKTKWTLKYLNKIFNLDNRSDSWLSSNNDNGYRQYQRKILLDSESSKIPETLMKMPMYKIEEENNKLKKDLRERNNFLLDDYCVLFSI